MPSNHASTRSRSFEVSVSQRPCFAAQRRTVRVPAPCRDRTTAMRRRRCRACSARITPTRLSSPLAATNPAIGMISSEGSGGSTFSSSTARCPYSRAADDALDEAEHSGALAAADRGRRPRRAHRVNAPSAWKCPRATCRPAGLRLAAQVADRDDADRRCSASTTGNRRICWSPMSLSTSPTFWSSRRHCTPAVPPSPAVRCSMPSPSATAQDHDVAVGDHAEQLAALATGTEPMSSSRMIRATSLSRASGERSSRLGSSRRGFCWASSAAPHSLLLGMRTGPAAVDRIGSAGQCVPARAVEHRQIGATTVRCAAAMQVGLLSLRRTMRRARKPTDRVTTPMHGYLPAHRHDEDSMTHRPLSSASIPAALAGLALLGGLSGRRTPTS